jgi:hypothetical protein
MDTRRSNWPTRILRGLHAFEQEAAEAVGDLVSHAVKRADLLIG